MKVNVKKITDATMVNYMSQIAASRNYEYSRFREIEDMNFIFHCNSHLSRRGYQRCGVAGETLWVDSCIDLLTEDEETFWSVLENDEVFLFDNENNAGYFLKVGYENINGVIVNDIYIKTYLPLEGVKSKIFVNNASVVSYDRTTNAVSDKNDKITKVID